MKYFVTFFLTAIIAMAFGYSAGIHKATTSDGWREGDKFVLEVEGQLYEWWLDEE